MKKGMLIYDSSTNRFDVLYEEGNSYGGRRPHTVKNSEKLQKLSDEKGIRKPRKMPIFRGFLSF